MANTAGLDPPTNSSIRKKRWWEDLGPGSQSDTSLYCPGIPKVQHFSCCSRKKGLTWTIVIVNYRCFTLLRLFLLKKKKKTDVT